MGGPIFATVFCGKDGARDLRRNARGRLCGIVLAGSKKRRREWVLFGTLLLLFFLEIACGGGHTAPPPPTPKNYIVTVTATAGAITHTTQVAVTVE